MDMFWVMVTTSVIMGCGIPIALVWTRHRERIAEIETGEEKAELRERNHELGARLAVLERIVTDKGYDVASQIDALRDTPATAAHTGRDNGVPLTMNAKERV